MCRLNRLTPLGLQAGMLIMAVVGRKKTISDQEILREIALSPDPIVTTSEIGDKIGMSPQGVYSRFVDLCEDGLIDSRQVGASARVWWLTDAGRQELAAASTDSD